MNINISPDKLKSLAVAFRGISVATKQIAAIINTLIDNDTVENVPSNDPLSILEDDFLDASRDYIYSSNCVWGAGFTGKFFRDMVGNRLRCNAMSFVWAHTGGDFNDRKNWKKISKSKAEDIFERVVCAHDELQDFLRDAEKPSNIRVSKWERRDAILGSTMPPTMLGRGGYKRALMDVHDDLPKLK
jgi:hypothetical protein